MFLIDIDSSVLYEITLPLTMSRSFGSSPHDSATMSRICLRASLAAATTALPMLQVRRLATVCHSYGLYFVSTGPATFTQSYGTPSAAAAICAITVNEP